jgi:SET domain-containing protein
MKKRFVKEILPEDEAKRVVCFISQGARCQEVNQTDIEPPSNALLYFPTQTRGDR